MEGSATLFRCALCGVESPERACFAFLKRYRNPLQNIRCVMCAQARARSTGVGSILTVLFTLASPFLYASFGPWSLDGSAPLAVCIVLGCLAYPVALAIHELAHAVTGYLVGLEIGAVVLGFGPVVWKFELRGVAVRLHSWPLSGRVFFGFATLRWVRSRLWIATFMGPFSNVLLVIAISTWWKAWAPLVGTAVIAAWILVNVMVALFNLIPRTGVGMGGSPYRSDGQALLDIPRRSDAALEANRFGALLVRALYRFELEDFGGAQAWFEKARQRGADNPYVILGLSACQMSLGQYAEGRAQLASLQDRGDLTPAMRATANNNMAFALVMPNAGEGADREQLTRVDRLTSEAMALFPCILEFRATRALLLAATQRPEEALQLLEYVNYKIGSPRQTSMRAAVRAFALRKLGRSDEAEQAAALAVRLSPNICTELRALGIAIPPPAPRPTFAAWRDGIVAFLISDMRRTVEQVADPEPLGESYPVIARLAGAVLLLLGAGLFALALSLVIRAVGTHGHFDREVLISLLVLAGLALFCSNAGWRFALNRPNRYGSVLSPAGWLTLSTLFVILTLLLLSTYFLAKQGPALNPFLLSGPLAFAAMCWVAGRAAARRARP